MRSIKTIVTPADSSDLTTLTRVKRDIGVDPGDTSRDDELLDLIREASSIVSDYCGREFAQETITETFWPDRVGEYITYFCLERVPIVSVTSVTVDDLVIDPSLYRIDAEDGLLYALDSSGYQSFWFLWKSAIITYVGGYVLLDGLPRAIERGTVLLVRETWSQIGRDPRVKSETIPDVMAQEFWVGGLSGGAAGELSPDVQAMLAPHRRIRV